MVIPQTTARARMVLALVIAGSVLVVIDMTIVSVGLPSVRADLGGTPADLQWVVIAYLVSMGAVTQVAGSLSDRLGRRRVYLAGIVLFTLSSLACGLAPNLPLLDVARAVQGIGGAVLMANGMPLIAQQYQGQRRNMAIAAWSTAGTAAGLIAPVFGGLLIEGLSWRAMFLLNVPVGVLAFALASANLPRDTDKDSGKPGIDWAGAGLLICSLGLGTFAMLRGEDQGWGSATTLIQFAVAAALLLVFLRVESKAATPTLDLALFRVPAFTGAALAIFMSRMLTIGGTVYFIQYFQESLGLTPTQSGFLLVPVSVAHMATGMLGGWLQSRLPSGYVIALGYGCRAIGAAWLGLAFTATAEPWLLAVPLLLWGAGGGIAGAPVMSVAVGAVDDRHAGMVSGTVTSLASIGAGVGTAALGVLYQRLAGTPGTAESIADGASAVLYCSAALSVLIVAVVLVLIKPVADGPRKRT
ncbi:MFS transporter [Amycolatopsis nigrescens]|uniref:MFS transporter n=1 Tax=Amycolatopsis nigrescens TaxID=381445 RepID=UPI000364491E|nr:MFS transporter [Amycolatopsis nigrescens]